MPPGSELGRQRCYVSLGRPTVSVPVMIVTSEDDHFVSDAIPDPNFCNYIVNYAYSIGYIFDVFEERMGQILDEL
ncbi:unnamed protein product [Nezara viridula]|uniref:Uncharacterized protein n=1 Tax=Nezara viridula TaxID=85310 RepID=A0A9P0MJ95_NEZVI|nr:unnamed protein product [Nezara viridula]